MTHASDIRFQGVATRDAKLGIDPCGAAVAVVDLAVHEGESTVYVPVKLEEEIAREVCRRPIAGDQFLVWGYFFRPRKSDRNPFPQLMVKAHMFKRIAQVETGRLFEGVW